ncbi:Gfo/Idh/MocA family oxidoreductase [Sphingorhabdus sp. Alg231-15]|uniref:Gfo/Idh/MocA family oxidoreductase n=1 Tax=Sphingorhabdus sp. Alg231-15 TaxID=1922222 RepID=UPI000D552B20
MTNLRIAIMGYGKIAKDQHVPAIAKTDGAELVAIVSSRSESPEGVPVFASLKELADSAVAVDAIALCTPPKGRTKIARDALSRGWHVLLEKPPGATLTEVEHLSDYAESTGLTLFATWHAQYNEAVDKAAALLANQEIISFAIHWCENVRKWHPGQTWIWEAGGFGVFDPGINALSIATKILPMDFHVHEASLFVAENHQAPIAADIKFSGSFAEEASAHFDFRTTDDEIWTMTVKTNAHSLSLERGGSLLKIDDQVIVKQHANEEYRLIYEEFVNLVRTGQSNVDLAPLKLTADALMIGRRHSVAPFPD